MAQMSDYLEDALINGILRGTPFSTPSVMAMALLTTGAADSDTGQFTTGTGVEVPNTNNYSRVDRPPSNVNWDATSGSDGKTANTAVITFPTPGAGGWGLVTDTAFTDSATHDAGNMLFYGSLAISNTIAENNVVSYPAGTLTVTLA